MISPIMIGKKMLKVVSTLWKEAFHLLMFLNGYMANKMNTVMVSQIQLLCFSLFRLLNMR